MPNGYAPEVERIPAGWTWQDYQAFVAWVTQYYQPRLLASTGDWNETQRQLQGILADPSTADYWRRFVKSATAPTRDPYGLLTPAEARRRFADMMERNVASGIWTEAQAASQAEKFATSIAEHGITYDTPFYGSLEQQVGTFTGAGWQTPAERMGITQGEYQRMIGGVGGAPFLGATAGPLGFAGTRRPQDVQPRLTAGQYEARIRASLPGLPSGRGMMEEALEGWASPAMQQYFMSQFPYLFEKFGGEERRVSSQAAYKKLLGQLGALGAKRRGAQWVLGKKAEYLPQVGTTGAALYPFGPAPAGTSYQASYEATRSKIAGLSRQEAALQSRTARGWTDPWAGYLAKYPWLEKFIRIPPAQRGFYPSRFAPMTRWL